jgi:alkanesulfonate monooxygenase SsuD/methylene tetrahydromethanopterin reductase-like flavin-dependent oxidoreductase (luciferase family)
LRPQYYLSIVPDVYDSFSDLAKAAIRAEELGYFGLGIGEHYPTKERPQWRPDPFVTLASLSQTTKQIKLGTLALSASTRHPVLLANSASTLYNITGGRFFLCLGVGSGKEEEYSANGFHYTSVQDRLQALEETLAIIRGLSRSSTSDASFTFEGKYYKLHDAQIFRKDSFPQIWVGERNSRRVLGLAGKYADFINIHCNNPRHARNKTELARAFAVEGGRSKNDLDAVIKHFVILAKDKDLVAERLGYDELKTNGENPSSFIERQRKENPDTIIGTPDQVREQYKSYIEAGFDKFTPILLPNTLDKVGEGMELFAKNMP